MAEIKVGDELAFGSSGWAATYKIHKVERITPSGRIVCGRYTLNPDLTIRGSRNAWGPYRAEVVTQEIRDEIEKQDILSVIGATNWQMLDLEHLRKVKGVLVEWEESLEAESEAEGDS